MKNLNNYMHICFWQFDNGRMIPYNILQPKNRFSHRFSPSICACSALLQFYIQLAYEMTVFHLTLSFINIIYFFNHLLLITHASSRRSIFVVFVSILLTNQLLHPPLLSLSSSNDHNITIPNLLNRRPCHAAWANRR